MLHRAPSPRGSVAAAGRATYVFCSGVFATLAMCRECIRHEAPLLGRDEDARVSDGRDADRDAAPRGLLPEILFF